MVLPGDGEEHTGKQPAERRAEPAGTGDPRVVLDLSRLHGEPLLRLGSPYRRPTPIPTQCSVGHDADNERAAVCENRSRRRAIASR